MAQAFGRAELADKGDRMGMESQRNEHRRQEALLELGFGPDPPGDDAPNAASSASADLSSDQEALEADIETDPALVPAGA